MESCGLGCEEGAVILRRRIGWNDFNAVNAIWAVNTGREIQSFPSVV